MKKKVLFVHHYSLISGAEKVLINVLSNIDKGKFQSVLCCPCGKLAEQFSHNGIKFYPCNIPVLKRTCNPFLWVYFLYRSIALTVTLVCIIRKEHVELIYANSFTACLFCGLAARVSNTALIWHMHDLIRQTRFNGLFISLAGKWADKVIATSNIMKNNLIECGVSPGKIETVHNGIDLNEYDRAKVSKNRFRDEIGADANTRLIGIVGQITPWKGQKDFLRAASMAKKELSHVRFLIVGDSHLGDNETYRHELGDLAAGLGLDEYVIFMGFREDIRNVIGSLDILVNASWSEPFGMTIIEAMALGVPVIATKAGGVVEIITDGVNGLLFTSGNAKQLAQALLNMLNNPFRAKDMVRNASGTVADRFSLAHQVTRIENIIQNC